MTMLIAGSTNAASNGVHTIEENRACAEPALDEFGLTNLIAW